PACLIFLGFEPDFDLNGQDMHDLIHHTHPDGTGYPRENCPIFKAIQTGTGTHVDNEVFWRKDGTSFPTEYWSYPIRKNDLLIGAVVTFWDITERKNAEKKLNVLLTQQNIILENASVGIVMVQDRIQLMVNRKMAEMFKYSIKEMEGRSTRI
ncbi:MAG: PAS domain-containing protein, partial [Deltaproteobacteria bacterium]|nr:PAS domain-containing protein [Deltaproteobacteria bacterium]